LTVTVHFLSIDTVGLDLRTAFSL